MQSYVANQVPTYVASWLKQNVNPVGSAVMIDNSLTIQGAAADAKKTNEMLQLFNDVTTIDWTPGGYIITNDDKVDINNVIEVNYYQYAIFDCSENEVFYISGQGGIGPRLWCFVDNENKILSRAEANVNVNNMQIISPKNSTRLVMNRSIKNTQICYRDNRPKATEKDFLEYVNFNTLKKVEYNENMLDISTCITGGYHDYDDTWKANDKMYSSGLIHCESGDTFSINYLQDILFYDINKNFLGRVQSEKTTTKFKFTVPTFFTKTVRYFRVYGLTKQLSTDGVYRGTVYIGSSVSLPYGTRYPFEDKIAGKLIYAFGDSRTGYDLHKYPPETVDQGSVCIGYISWLRRYLSTAVYNHGVSAYTTPKILGEVNNTDLSNADIVIIAGGINDFLQSVSIGEIKPIGSTFDTTTVYGALQSTIERIINVKPTAKIMLINPFVGWIKNDTKEFPETYAVIKRNIAELYRLPLLDLTKYCGFNSLNRDSFFTDDMSKVSYRLHLNNLGNAIIGQMVASFIVNGY